MFKDLRYGVRMLLKSPGFTGTTVLTLAIGIGAASAIFSIVNAVVLNPYPYRDQKRLFFVRHNLPKIGALKQVRSSGPEFLEIAETTSFEHVAAFEPVSRNLTGGQVPERIAAAKVSSTWFDLLGVSPILGRTISPQEQGSKGQRVLVIGHGLWQKRFGGERDVIGKTVSLDDEPFTIIGVMPPRFRFDGAEAWFPFPFDFQQTARSNRSYPVISLIKENVSVEQAEAELELLARRNEQSFAATNPEYAGRTFFLEPIAEFYMGTLTKAVLILFGAVGLVLLVACANVAGLLLARSMGRTHEISVRIALGAGRFAIVRQMLAESAVLALLGGGIGVLAAIWGIDALVAFAPDGAIPAGVEVRMDSRVLMFAVAVSLLTCFIFGLWPALESSRPDMEESLKSGSTRATASRRNLLARNLLVVGEIGLALVLLVMAGLMIRTFARLTAIDPGFNPDNLLTMRVNRSPAKSEQGRKNAVFFQQLTESVRNVPGVIGVAVMSHSPFVMREDWTVTVDNKSLASDQATVNVDTRTVSPEFFNVMGIPLKKGEVFAASDTADFSTEEGRAAARPVVIVNEVLANRFWPGEEAVGKRLKVGKTDSTNPWFEIKGIVGNSAQQVLDQETKPEAYFAIGQLAWRYRRMNLVVRTQSDPQSMVGSIQNAVWSVDKDQPVYEVRTFDEMIGRSLSTRRFVMFLLAVFGAIALALAGIGIYALISYSVSRRTHEIGVRLALGAQSRDVVRMVLRNGMMLTVAGVGIGIVAVLLLARLMVTLLYEVGTSDARAIAGSAVVLTVVASLACYVPARRAAKVDPMTALRYE